MTLLYKHFRTRLLIIAVALISLTTVTNGADEGVISNDPIAELLNAIAASSLQRLGYTIQVGAFANLDNAVRLDSELDSRGIDSFYFRHDSGLYKVRFGNYRDRSMAVAEAIKLRNEGVIDSFYIVAPEEYMIAKIDQAHTGDLRDELVRTALRYMGVPYRWGGVNDEDGFDCSGLTMVCYRLNGLNLPRVSKHQFTAGQAITKGELRLGDLVFFSTRGKGIVSHVGLYIGNDRFIHAPRTGENVQIESLRNPYYTEHFVGARSYF